MAEILVEPTTRTIRSLTEHAGRLLGSDSRRSFRVDPNTTAHITRKDAKDWHHTIVQFSDPTITLPGEFSMLDQSVTAVVYTPKVHSATAIAVVEYNSNVPYLPPSRQPTFISVAEFLTVLSPQEEALFRRIGRRTNRTVRRRTKEQVAMNDFEMIASEISQVGPESMIIDNWGRTAEESFNYKTATTAMNLQTKRVFDFINAFPDAERQMLETRGIRFEIPDGPRLKLSRFEKKDGGLNTAVDIEGESYIDNAEAAVVEGIEYVLDTTENIVTTVQIKNIYPKNGKRYSEYIQNERYLPPVASLQEVQELTATLTLLEPAMMRGVPGTF